MQFLKKRCLLQIGCALKYFMAESLRNLSQILADSIIIFDSQLIAFIMIAFYCIANN